MNNFKKNLLISAIVFAMTIIHTKTVAQAPNWLWAKSEGSINYSDAAFSAATDASGNTYITGYFSSPTIQFGSTTLTNSGNWDFFIVKYDPSGNVLWAKSAGGNDMDQGTGVAIDPNGNAYVTGSFKSATISFGSNILTNPNSLSYDIFIAKYDPSGNILWAKRAGGLAEDVGNIVSCDINGNVYLTGYFESTSIQFGSTTLTNAGNLDVFVAKYDPSGTVLWAKRAGGSYRDMGNSVSTDANGNVCITGVFASSSIQFGSTTLTNANVGSYAFFVTKYDPSGNVLWAQTAVGSGGIDHGNGVSTDTQGNVYVTGSFQSYNLAFGSTTLTNAGSYNIFIAKYDPLGNILWAKGAGGTSVDWGTSIATDGNDNVYITGYFNSPTVQFGATALTNAGFSDIFIAKYSTSGNVLWAKKAGGTSADTGYGITAGSTGNVCITGLYNSAALQFGSTTLTGAGTSGPYSIFTAKLIDDVGIAEENIFSSINIFPNPNNGSLCLTFDNDIKNGEIILFNSLGQKVYEQTVSQGKNYINIPNKTKGLYNYILFSNKQKIKNGKIAVD